ncbi:hypothetical protein EVAR_67426_1 [Eumeta japonica]|uniref:Uncharacterized protein n=1 Tax=Eumeta variegata TaxID=151549 RepID=A0A4C2A6I8_EUMVA|nr:hypothetical protein EVAR_67426_1 [Eumeta japonica]
MRTLKPTNNARRPARLIDRRDAVNSVIIFGSPCGKSAQVECPAGGAPRVSAATNEWRQENSLALSMSSAVRS